MTHAQLATARVKLDQAEFHSTRVASTVDRHIHDGLPWDLEIRVRCRSDVAEDGKLSREVCKIIEHASGASAIHVNDPLPAILRDVRTIFGAFVPSAQH